MKLYQEKIYIFDACKVIKNLLEALEKLSWKSLKVLDFMLRKHWKSP